MSSILRVVPDDLYVPQTGTDPDSQTVVGTVPQLLNDQDSDTYIRTTYSGQSRIVGGHGGVTPLPGGSVTRVWEHIRVGVSNPGSLGLNQMSMFLRIGTQDSPSPPVIELFLESFQPRTYEFEWTQELVDAGQYGGDVAQAKADLSVQEGSPFFRLDQRLGDDVSGVPVTSEVYEWWLEYEVSTELGRLKVWVPQTSEWKFWEPVSGENDGAGVGFVWAGDEAGWVRTQLY